MKTSKVVLLLSLAFAAHAAYAQIAADPLLAAKEALALRQADKALAILQPLEEKLAGDATYDYLLGVARLDSGDAERAVFAFERVLSVQPNNALARAEIGRAYLQLGERDAGVKELETARKMDVPDEARKTMERYLGAFGAGPTRLSGYLEMTAGYDSNVNSAVSAERLVIPLVGLELTLSRDARRQPDSFYGVAGGLNFAHPLAEKWSLLGGVSLNSRFNGRYDQFDTRNLDGNVGLRYASGANAYTIGLQAQAFDVKEHRYRDVAGLVAQWQHQLDAQTQITLFGQHIQLRYPTQQLRDADRSILGLAGAKVFPGVWSPSLYASIYGGNERDIKTGGSYLGHKPLGIRFGGEIKPTSTVSIFANASYENRRYSGIEPLFLVRRDDKQLDVRIGMNYEPYRYWVVSPQVSYTRNDSNVALNDFTRTVAAVTVRREF